MNEYENFFDAKMALFNKFELFSQKLLQNSVLCAIIFAIVSVEAFGIARDRSTEELWRIPQMGAEGARQFSLSNLSGKRTEAEKNIFSVYFL